jgi:hypothetical protein
MKGAGKDICGYEGRGNRRRLHNEELLDFYSSPNIFRVIKPKEIRWTGL